MDATGGATGFGGHLLCAHDNDTKITDKLEVLFIKHVPESVEGIKLTVAKDLYMASDFTNNPDKSPKKFAQEAVERAEAFCNVLKEKGLL